MPEVTPLNNESAVGSGCALAIEFKKFFMDEWSGALYPGEHQAILDALRSCVPGVLEEARQLARA